ncbi:DUF6735 family protein [Halostella sp. PRR32]|uniref:DUF6735 family protein n=1 Tax=Halostella sp. PRR32 TaxID=3098147 RepID=UPI002B1E6ECA|nr:DUF6735 family protein [Halostella sp. PRR32]
MAHRALVAYERPNGNYDLHRSRWGGSDLSLARRIAEDTPFGGAQTGAARVRRGPSLGSSPRPVDRRPVATDLDFDGVVDAVDFRQHEALFVVATDYDTTAYLSLWFGLPSVSEPSFADGREDADERSRSNPRSTSSHEDAAGTSSGEPSLADAREDAGALVAADPDGGPYGGPRLRRWFRATKAVVADVVAEGTVSCDEAAAYLADRAREHVGERREVIVRE